MQKAPPTPKGFRDILPEKAAKRRRAINTISDVLEKEGFQPLETPTIEFAETLTGKYGEEERLIYKFKDRGDRELALRYDLTVPLARFVANNQNLIVKGPFRRYQIGQVFRGENPQAGRYREFTQFDFDTVGSAGLEEDAKIIATALKAVKKIGLPNAIMLVNDRETFKNVPLDFIRALDKYQKVGKDGVIKELLEKDYTLEKINNFLDEHMSGKTTKRHVALLEELKKEGVQEKDIGDGRKGIDDVVFDPTLARGLDYYTGSIFELKPDDSPASLSIGAGGRYDNLIGMFAGRQIPAVGFSFGIDRIVDLL